ncbi:immunity 49 family protein [Streptomyces ipomoeae]|uniref:immunity 49 family protein n=2 Tax=Streptomyces ipomoeae TaxID=103232 RepID=UPI0029A52F45|nr:immunity 49 family protein [Streptomyces ipomoeae]MDX2824794.1 immunity 49 family protein [Streptomyces ipomoeae]
MRIERHRVGAAAITAVRQDFFNRIGTQLRSMSKAGPMTADEWWLLSEELVEYLAALSVETPDLHTPEAKAVLDDATEAATGAVAYTAYHGHDRFHVFLPYMNFGITYEPEENPEENPSDKPAHNPAAQAAHNPAAQPADNPVAQGTRRPTTLTPHQWLDAFCLAILSDKAEHHGEAFHFAREASQEGGAGRPPVELINGFMAYVIGDTGDDDANHPPSRTEKLTALDTAVARIRTLDHMTGGAQGLLSHPHTTALHALRALTACDQAAFRTHLAELLHPYSTLSGPSARPSSLLPLVPLALTALAYRQEGWEPPIDTDYLPHALVNGFESPGPRVKEYGRDRRPDAVAELAAGPVHLERPDNPQPLHPQSEAYFEEYALEGLTRVDGKPLSAPRLAQSLTYRNILLKARASLSADVTDQQLANLRLAAEMGAALFRTTLAEPGTQVDVTIAGRGLTYPAYHGDQVGPGAWQTAANLALITGVREHLAPVVLAGPARLRNDDSAFGSYRKALLIYLQGAEDPEPLTDKALQDHEKAKNRGFFPPPTILFSQLVEGDAESFNLALLDALESHRDHYRIADRADTSDAALNLDILALTCHARRRGWPIRITTPYLPPRLLQSAKPF